MIDDTLIEIPCALAVEHQIADLTVRCTGPYHKAISLQTASRNANSDLMRCAADGVGSVVRLETGKTVAGKTDAVGIHRIPAVGLSTVGERQGQGISS
ncbi:tRNA-specific 2-thiouridylase MnmA [Pseudomonas sp. StFLB209]|nr:tRNA-specific 2-thiouridylase MnmA [Pseudomonas sp. StFLB209]